MPSPTSWSTWPRWAPGGAGPTHALAPELTLRPVLTEIGGTTVRGLYVLDSRHEDPDAYADWLALVRPVVSAQLATGVPA